MTNDGRRMGEGLRPVVLTVIVCLIFVTSGYALKKIPSARNLPQREDFKSFPMQIGEWQGKRSYIDQEILEQLWSDDYVQATYFKPKSRNAIHVLIPFYEYQGTRHTAHAPQACLLGGRNWSWPPDSRWTTPGLSWLGLLPGCGRFCRNTFQIELSRKGAEAQRENKSK